MLTSPDTCGPHTANAAYTPFSRADATDRSGAFTLDEIAGGGNCPKTLAERPFAPFYKAAPQSTTAGQFTPFQVDFIRDDGNQEVKRIDVNLPPGMVAKLKGVEYCPEASIAAAESGSGKDQMSNPSCPDSSRVGPIETAAGSGSDPFQASGSAYLAGPYKGAPLSMVFITPAVAGPYDLGNVVVRAALNVNPETAEVRAVSDPIPNVFGGVKLDIRKIHLVVDRAQFALNPTTCREPLPVNSVISSGGGNPANEADWQQTNVSDQVPVPRLRRSCSSSRSSTHGSSVARTRPSGRRTRSSGRSSKPATATPTCGARRSSCRGRRSSIRATSRPSARGSSWPPTNARRTRSTGTRTATSPLLAGNLKGPVYLTSSSHELPDLLVDLHGQIPVRLRGVISSAHGRLKTVFNETPDVAVKKFILTMKGGSKGLLINSRNLCSRQTTGFLNMLAQNSRRMRTNNLRLNIPACRSGKKN